MPVAARPHRNNWYPAPRWTKLICEEGIVKQDIRRLGSQVETIRRFICIACVLTFAAWLTGCESTPRALPKKQPNKQNTVNSISNVNASDAAGAFDPALYANATLSAGARLYDKWWRVSDQTPAPATPTTTHPIWEETGNTKTGDVTWRCASCHGWDYMGYLGNFGKSNSDFYTGIRGIVGTADSPALNLDAPSVYQFIHSGILASNGKSHEFGTLVSDSDIYNLTLFVVSMQDEASKSLSPRDLIAYDTGQTQGNEGRGKTLYASAPTEGGCAEAACHGPDGRAIDFADGDVATLPNSFVDTAAMRDPWKNLHTIRFGSAGSAMLGLQDVATVATPQKAALDALAYAQNGLIPSTTGFDYRQYQHPESDTSHVAWDFARGGRLYDQWWVASSLIPAPASPADTAIHPLWPSTNPTVGPATFRCANCHGWDYAGVNGVLGNTDLTANPRYTGIKGILPAPAQVPTRQSPAEIYDFLHSGQITSAGDHAFAANLTQDDLYGLTRLIVTLRDESLAKGAPSDFIDAATGLARNVNQRNGQISYNTGSNAGGCSAGCHGADGRLRPLRGSNDMFVRDVARNRGAETLHKIRFGLANLSGGMYGLADYGYVMPGPAADILGYAQNGVGRNSVRGGRLYDDWMLEAAITAPPATTPNPLLDLPQPPPLTGKDSWKCSSCHGFDYQGTPNYGNNLIELKRVRNWSEGYLYDFLKNGRTTLNIPKHQQTVIHNFGAFMSDSDLWELSGFAMEQIIDTRRYFTAKPFAAIGKLDNGQFLFGGANNLLKLGRQVSSCGYCHGADGRTIPAGSTASGMDIFHIAWTDPLRFFHRTRFGMPGSFGQAPRMPGLLELDLYFSNGGLRRLENTDAADIAAYAQKMMIPGVIR